MAKVNQTTVLNTNSKSDDADYENLIFKLFSSVPSLGLVLETDTGLNLPKAKYLKLPSYETEDRERETQVQQKDAYCRDCFALLNSLLTAQHP